MTLSFRWLLAICGVFLFLPSVSAHDARPLVIELTEDTKSIYDLKIQIPSGLDNFRRPVVVIDGCQNKTKTILSCQNGLSGSYIKIDYPYANPSLATLIKVNWKSGEQYIKLLTPDIDKFLIPSKQTLEVILKDYTWLGMVHIWKGLDHLLFVAGLFLLTGGFRQLVITISGFTVAHSITLGLSALGIVSLPVGATETVIALSILFLARELLDKNPKTLAKRYPVVVASSFGLLHGFGFAAVLSEIGLPDHAFLASLFSFNVGVEIGQILFIGILIWLRRMAPLLSFFGGKVTASLTIYSFGGLSGFWFIDRFLNIL